MHAVSAPPRYNDGFRSEIRLPMSTPNPPAYRAPLLSTAEALSALLAAAAPVAETESVSTRDALGRVLAADIASTLDVPPVHTSAMDGYAVRAADLTHGERRLPMSQRVAAGQSPQPLAEGTAARIFTGAPVPPGADAVVMQEQAEADGGVVSILHTPKAGEWITAQGADIRRGAVILPAGTRLSPQALGLAASVGCASLEVTRRLKVAVFFTGDELTMPGEPLAPGGIYNSNRFTLVALLKRLNCDVTDLGIVPDRLDATCEALTAAARDHDLILTSGGVSVGEEDHVKPAVESLGRLALWQIALKPGKPLAFGAVRKPPSDAAIEGVAETHFIGLPGNPVSSFVTFLLFVRPFLLRLSGMRDVAPHALSLRADFTQAKSDRRNEFLRARINAAGGLALFANQSSAVLTSTVWGDGLIDNPPNHAISAGETVRFLPFSELLG